MTEPVDPAADWLARAGRLANSGDLEGAARLAAQAVAQQPDTATLWNMHGALLAALGRTTDGVAAFERAAALDPADPEPLRNLFSVQLGRRDWEAASRAAGRLLALNPGDAQAHRLVGLAAAGARDLATAEGRLRDAAALDPRAVEIWLELIAVVGLTSTEKAIAVAEAAVGANPHDPRLNAAKSELAGTLALDRALASDPADPLLLERRLALMSDRLAQEKRASWSPVHCEGLALQKAHDAVLAAVEAGLAPQRLPPAAPPILARLLAWDPLEALWRFDELEGSADPRNLMMRLPSARATAQGRLEMIGHHRRWGERAQAAAARGPVAVTTRPADGRIRLGFVSSDLRTHPVGAFAWPLFQHADRDRFDLYVYSVHAGAADPLQAAIAQRSTYRILPGADPKSLAELIAGDQLDVLFDLGGLTGANRPEVMAYRLAPMQASWLAYPHSMGLSTIDYLLVDPYLAPPDAALLIEQPLVMPHSWIAMGEAFFRPEPAPAPQPPQVRNGFTTFGTASSSYKYSPACLEAWARVLAAAPGSRFLIVRPEADAPSFRSRVLEGFASQGVSPDRIEFQPVWGAHLPFYDRIDVSLDTLPLTGGTTTCESLWMGVPVVSLVGEALYERLSYSILTNAGLGDLAVESVDAYVATAVGLAADTARLTRLRSGLREQIRARPLADTAGFARDFYELIARTVSERSA